MALTVVKRPLSGSTGGLPINGLTTASGTVIHLGQSTTTVTDEVFLFANLGSSQTTSMILSLIINSQTYTVSIPVNALEYPVLTGFPIIGNASASNGRRIEAHVNTGTAAFTLSGWVNRVTES